jgi:hypothetical protein
MKRGRTDVKLSWFILIPPASPPPTILFCEENGENFDDFLEFVSFSGRTNLLFLFVYFR